MYLCNDATQTYLFIYFITTFGINYCFDSQFECLKHLTGQIKS